MIRSFLTVLFLTATAFPSLAVDPWNSVRIPEIGDYRMLVLTPTMVELSLVTTREKGKAETEWNFASGSGALSLPAPDTIGFVVSGGDAERRIAAKRLGFKRRVRYAPLNRWDLRIGSRTLIELAEPVSAGERLTLDDPSGKLTLDGELGFAATFAPQNFTPLLHVSQAGYPAGGTKIAKAGYYLGSLGELDLSAYKSFYVRNTRTGEIALEAPIVVVSEQGFDSADPPYQRVLHLDFTGIRAEGVYAVGIRGLGESYPFWITDGYWACLTRTFALGTYHQRCGCALEMPFSRFTHGPCHTHPAQVPTMDPEFARTQQLIRDITDPDNPAQKAPEMVNTESSLYPIVTKGPVDVRGGHHDAGDYSRYTINSALFANALMTAVDSFPGVAELDNLGLPESDDGIGDLLQIAKYETDFLAKMQDEDGGFFFLVYPKERAYENDVAPDKGDPQVVFPKNTASTAAAVAALAQAASSRKFKFHYPMEAGRMLEQARRGWEFLERAWAAHGEDGAYQTISHYGDIFMDRDEIAWAATELFLATGEAKYHDYLLKHFDPQNPDTRHWKWLRLYEGYGAAIRSYAFAETSGRLSGDRLDRVHLRACFKELLDRSEELAQWSRDSAYGVSFPPDPKRLGKIGWFFAGSDAFDMASMAVAGRLDKYDSAIETNLGYELGANPNNVTFLTGLGWLRQFEIVHQWSHNDRFALPMTGIPLGSLQDGLPWIPPYESELGKFNFPSDGGGTAAFAFYDRWSDTFNVATEFVNFQQARALATCAYFMAKTKAASQRWKSGTLAVRGLPESGRIGQPVTLAAVSDDPSLPIGDAFVVWETRSQQPLVGPEVTITPQNSGPQWISVEAQWPDGRRTCYEGSFTATRADGGIPVAADSRVTFLLNADLPETQAKKPAPLASEAPLRGMPHPASVGIEGTPRYSPDNLGWMATPAGAVLAFGDFGDAVTASWKAPALESTQIELSGWFYFEKFPHGVMTAELLGYGIGDSTPLLTLHFDQWDESRQPRIQLGHTTVLPSSAFQKTVKTDEWQFLMLRVNATDWQFLVDNREVARGRVPEGYALSLTESTDRRLRVGSFVGAVDELRVRELP